MPILFIMGIFCQGQESSDLPDPAVPGDPGYLSGELIFELDNKPTPECHASTIVETGSDLVAAWFAGSHERHPDVGIWISRFEEGVWTSPVEVATGIQEDGQRFPCWNPVLFQPEGEALMLFFKVGPSPREWWGELMVSEDQGRSWSEPQRLGESRLGHLIGPVKNKPVQLKDGSILCPSSTEAEDGRETLWKSHFELTRDLGKSWEVIGPVNDGKEFDAIQGSILSYEDGSMQVLCRTRQEKIAQCWSEDGGRSWGEMTATRLPNPNAGTDALSLQDGRQLLVYNHSLRRGAFPSGREILNVAISEDGFLWKPVLTLEKQKGEYSYPAVIQSSDGKVHITYTYRRESIKHVILNPEAL